ncbi:dTDP-4-dehydrorhamnose 3,5-epimerase [Bosea sp. R86505]|uniref:dTDP-4-dehydrorhamnose 3,5-epimerase n=1 Tax=Bosea sp. R86505 TaxID=3101710 RepID=UPI00366D1ABA
MKIEALTPVGLYLLTPEPITDVRGFFARCFSRDEMVGAGLVADYPEWSLSFNRRRGTLRGLHMQRQPHAEVKMVQCIRGAVLDVAVDLRPDSPTFGAYRAIELSSENRRSFYIPAGFAHGYQTLTDDAELLYHISVRHAPDHACGVRWDDPDLAIEWPEADGRTISDRDLNLPFLAALTTEWRIGTV